MDPARERAPALAAAWPEAVGIRYAVGGRALLHLLEMEIPGVDLDVLVPGEARESIESAPWPPLDPKEADPRFPSDWIRRFVVEGVTVEIIGSMRARLGDRVVDLPIGGGETATLAGRPVMLAPAGPWYHLYRRYRPDRAEALRRLVGDGPVVAAAAAMGLPLSSG